jgi:hypothetical protein
MCVGQETLTSRVQWGRRVAAAGPKRQDDIADSVADHDDDANDHKHAAPSERDPHKDCQSGRMDEEPGKPRTVRPPVVPYTFKHTGNLTAISTRSEARTADGCR